MINKIKWIKFIKKELSLKKITEIKPIDIYKASCEINKTSRTKGEDALKISIKLCIEILDEMPTQERENLKYPSGVLYATAILLLKREEREEKNLPFMTHEELSFYTFREIQQVHGMIR